MNNRRQPPATTAGISSTLLDAAPTQKVKAPCMKYDRHSCLSASAHATSQPPRAIPTRT